MILSTDIEITEELEATKTYKLSDKTIQGLTNELGAFEQAIYKVLNTERYEYPIYSFSYGIELESLIGKDPVYVKIELKRRIKECLTQDDRIHSVDNFRFTTSGDALSCYFDVIGIYGNLTITKEVNI